MVKSMRKTVSGDYKKRFEKGFKLLCSSKSSYQVWTMRRLFHNQDILGRNTVSKEEIKGLKEHEKDN